MLFLVLLACGSTIEKNEDTGSAHDTSEHSEPETTVEPEDTSDTQDPCGWQENQSADPLSLIGDESCGAQVYAQSCSICHMEDGSGGNSGKRLVGRMDLFDDQTLVDIILMGQGTMPPIAISSQKTADVVVFLRENF